MTQEEKKYFRDIKQALRKLSEIGVPVMPIIKAVMNAESELSESGDEWIRKHIIEILDSLAPCHWDGNEKSRCIAWLEKQKENPLSATEVLTMAGLKPYKDGDQWCILAGDNIQEGICGFGDTIDDALYQFLMGVLEKQKEQKPNQSEEEREYVKTLKGLVSDFIRDSGGISDVAYYQRICDWLDGRHIEQNSVAQNSESGDSENPNDHAEWSEEDEGRREGSIKHLEEYANMALSSLVPFIKKDIAWLKSLRPQPHWKPSEEQMEALHKCFKTELDEHEVLNETEYKLLTLYEELQNL